MITFCGSTVKPLHVSNHRFVAFFWCILGFWTGELRYLLFGGHGEALQPTRHVTQALLKGCHEVSLQTQRVTHTRTRPFLLQGHIMRVHQWIFGLGPFWFYSEVSDWKNSSNKKTLKTLVRHGQIKSCLLPWLHLSPEDTKATCWRIRTLGGVAPSAPLKPCVVCPLTIHTICWCLCFNNIHKCNLTLQNFHLLNRKFDSTHARKQICLHTHILVFLSSCGP